MNELNHINYFIRNSITRHINRAVRILFPIYSYLKLFFYKRKALINVGSPCVMSFDGLRMFVPDPISWYIEYKDIFVRRIYHFETDNNEPYIIDGGAYIGMATLYFKVSYPEARIVCFEPDPTHFKILQSNILQNNLENVELVNAGLAAQAGTDSFLPDGLDGGKIAYKGLNLVFIRTEMLSNYINRQVDFLKLNIEGQEFPVLEEVAARGLLLNVRELVIEYHGWPDHEQKLGSIFLISLMPMVFVLCMISILKLVPLLNPHFI